MLLAKDGVRKAVLTRISSTSPENSAPVVSRYAVAPRGGKDYSEPAELEAELFITMMMPVGMVRHKVLEQMAFTVS